MAIRNRAAGQKVRAKPAATSTPASQPSVERASPMQLARGYAVVALALQGGGALGAYQCGVYEALHTAGLRPNWFAGTSIGAINAAILAGNAPEHRLERLNAFWETICQPGGLGAPFVASVHQLLPWLPPSHALDAWTNSLGALGALMFGQQGFFELRPQSPFMRNDGSAAATSFYDTTPLRATLERLVDFDRINSAQVRLSVGATDVANGNLRYFDSAREPIRPEHIMASGALPPAFPAIEIDGRHYWDGGLASNTPLEHVLAEVPRRDSLILQVDLWSARGEVPQGLMEVFDRQKDIQFSSRTRLGTDHAAGLQALRHTIRRLLDEVPPEHVAPSLREALRPWTCNAVFNIVHLIYQAKPYEAQFKDYAFGLGTMRAHWADGRADMEQTLEHPEFFLKPAREIGVATHDVHRLATLRRRGA